MCWVQGRRMYGILGKYYLGFKVLVQGRRTHRILGTYYVDASLDYKKWALYAAVSCSPILRAFCFGSWFIEKV